MFGPLSVSFAPYVRSSRTLSKWLTPLSKWYVDRAGWRKYGFKYDDLCTFNLSVHCARINIVLSTRRDSHSPEGISTDLPHFQLLILRPQALSRLTPREYYDRSYRLKRACQASILHAPLPMDQWTKSEEVNCLVP